MALLNKIEIVKTEETSTLDNSGGRESFNSTPSVSRLSQSTIAQSTLPQSTLSKLSNSQKHAKNVMSDLGQLSQAFADSFQNIEVKVEQLSGQLNDAENRHLVEKNAKIKLQSENDKINNRLNNLLDILPSGVVLLDNQGFVCDCNKVAIDILGRPLLGEAWVDVIARAFSPQADDGHQVSLKDGRKIHIETTGLSPEPGQMLVLTDLTKTRRLQDKLSQNNKLSSMGKMIASLAHQIRTPLSAAMIYGSHINESNLEPKQIKSFSANLMERLKFMDRQIHDMLQFVRGERKQSQIVPISQLFDNLKNSIEHKNNVTWISGCGVEDKSLDKKLRSNSEEYYLLGNSDDLIGAISNLVENALAASKSKQMVELKSNIVCENTHKGKDNQYSLVIEVVDHGIGMSRLQQQQVFEPFYTTKSNGNGLGLAIVRGVIIEHGGSIDLESSIGVGSAFEIKLPLVNKTCLASERSNLTTEEVVIND
ncbi:MAG: PAS domain-containing sensor histidine kinase [Kangiella sp.]|nr:MAG: PAS domain-containing sensor histidine kinase [Kangiella sp.]